MATEITEVIVRCACGRIITLPATGKTVRCACKGRLAAVYSPASNQFNIVFHWLGQLPDWARSNPPRKLSFR